MLRCAPGSEHYLRSSGNQDAFLCRIETRSSSEAVVQKYELSSSIQCLDWSSSATNCLAFGQSNGTVEVFRAFKHGQKLKIQARQQRSCTSVKFNNSNLLAIGLEKVRNDSSLTIYDINADKAIGQFAGTEGVSSLTWFTDAPNYILAGLNYRWLRLIDVRSDPKDGFAISIPTKAVFTLTVDPADCNRFASSYGEVATIWDRRNGSSSAELSLAPSSGEARSRITQLHYSQTQRAHLAALREDSTMDLWQLHEVTADKSLELAPTRSHHKPANKKTDLDAGLRVSKHNRIHSKATLVDFDLIHSRTGPPSTWNLLALDTDGHVQAHTIKTTPLSINIGCRNDVAIVDGHQLYHQIAPLRKKLHLPELHYEDNASMQSEEDSDFGGSSPRLGHPNRRKQLSRQLSEVESEDADNVLCKSLDDVFNEDISTVMYRRAVANYEMNAVGNTRLALPTALQTVWKWIAFTDVAANKGKLTANDIDFSFEGALGIWKGTAGQLRKVNGSSISRQDKLSNAIQRVGTNFEQATKDNANLPVRRLALISTGWCMNEAEVKTFQNKLIQAGSFDKAAFYAMAQDSDVERAVQILSYGGSILRIMSAAIAGYLANAGQQEGRYHVWKDSCKRLATELDSPYIRAIFAFVSNGDWQDVLDEQSLTLSERLLVAIKYIKDDDLSSILHDICRTEVAEGNLEGLLLTGLTVDSIELIQKYVDRTGDIQTAALIASHQPELNNEKRVVQWVSDYRGLLNSWGLFHARCRFDVARNKRIRDAKLPAKNPPRQVFVRCNHCNSSITHKAASDKRDRLAYGSAGIKATLCPNCRKPLPKCVLCLLACGGDKLFNFCLTCSHSLHTDHAEQWFAKHDICPVPDCECKCTSRDTSLRL